MNVLVLNSGSSSIKYQLFAMGDDAVLVSGVLERIGTGHARLTHRRRGPSGEMTAHEEQRAVPDHRAGLAWIEEHLGGGEASGLHLDAIGHRVVHGGELFKEPTRISQQVVNAIREMSPLAPLHNPANLLGIEVSLELRPDVPQVAVFDTAFHQRMPPEAYHYALPYRLYAEDHVRRYGFHGTSHRFVAEAAARCLARPLRALGLITLHLGNGASAAAIQGGRCIDTSMGLTPLTGLVMGTRCGDIDPGILLFLARAKGLSVDDLDRLLNQESGLLGICGASDMRAVMQRAEAGDEKAALARDLFAYRIRKYVGAYYAALGHLDAVVFTGGIGENAPAIRAACLQGLAELGIRVDDTRNAMRSGDAREIQAAESRIKVLVVPTNEELEIARQTVDCLQASAGT